MPAANPSRTEGRPVHLTANLFAIAFGLAGLAQAWSTMMQYADGPAWPANLLWIVTAAVWLATLIGYLANVAAQHRWRSEISDPTFGPFTSLIVIVPMVMGVALAQHSRTAGEAVFLAGLVLMVCGGAWIVGDWTTRPTDIQRWHPGYFLPTAAGGLLAGGAAAMLGFATLSHVLFGMGVVTWLLLGSVLYQRLFTVPLLPPPLLPTIFIEVAPPAVAGNSWYAINGGRIDLAAAMLTGYLALALLIQIRLIPLYRRSPFGPGYWAFSFPLAAAVTFGVHWLAAEHVRGGTAIAYALVGALTAGFVVLGVRTAVGLAKGSFLPRAAG